MKYHVYVAVSEIEWGAIYNMVWYHCWWHFYISVDRKVVHTAASRYLHLNWWFESCYLLLILVLMKYIAFYYCIGCWWLTQPSFSDLFVDEVACIWQILIHLRPRKKMLGCTPLTDPNVQGWPKYFWFFLLGKKSNFFPKISNFPQTLFFFKISKH